MEKIEYMRSIIHTTTIQDAIVEQGKEWRKYNGYQGYHAKGDATLYFNTVIDSGHTSYYLKYWDNTYA